jgi:hypothetical protein
MPHYHEVISYTRIPDDPRILDAYDQIVSEWALTAEDPDAE